MTDDDISDLPRDEISDHDRAKALVDARRERVLDDPSAYPLHMLSGLLGWLAEMPAVRPIDPFTETPPLQDWHPLHLAEAMLAGNGEDGELMERFRRYGGKHWLEAVSDAAASIPDDVAASDAADAARDAAEIEETQASLMPGRV